MTSSALRKPVPAVTPYLLSLRDALASARGKAPATFVVGELQAELRQLGTALWLIVRRERKGGIALRVGTLQMERARRFDRRPHALQ